MSHPSRPPTGARTIDLAGVPIVDVPPPADAAIDGLRSRLRGELLVPGTQAYEQSRRVWNGVIDRHPALIVLCAGAEDVISAVGFARDHGLPLSVRGGGHNVAGSSICEAGLVVDLSRMRGVTVDPARQTVQAEGGARLGDIDAETSAFGLAVPMGVVSRTGIAGLALHGGMGFLTRRDGLTSDNLVSADVVTADGRLLRVDEHHHPELLWALRGGGGSFGIVTSFEFRAHPVGPEVWMAIAMYPASRGPDALRFFRDFMASAPDELMAIAILWNSPTEEPVPEEARGVPVIVLAGCYSGSLDDGEEAVRPLREFDVPLVDFSGPMPLVDAQRLFDPDYPDGRRYYWKSAYLRDLDDDAIQALTGHAARRPSSISSLDIWALGGAMGRVPQESTAFAMRHAPFLLGIEANWDDPAGDTANIHWARDVFRDVQRFSTGGAYLNFPGFAEEGDDLFRKAYGPNYERLRAVKTQYDPGNLFRGNLSIAPLP